MLAIQTFRFLIGSKIPFSDWPQIVQSFLEKHDLHYKDFLYYFEDDYGALPKALKDCPQLGPIRERITNAGNRLYLSNIEAHTDCKEEDILSLMPKIYRRYGFSETHIIYQNVDFFSQHIPSIIQSPGNTPSCIKGSNITCYRDSVFHRWSSIDLQIIIHDGHTAFDPTLYFDTMKQLLPDVRTIGFTECCMTDDEQAAYHTRNQNAVPMVESARHHLKNLLPAIKDTPPHTLFSPKLSVAPVLKRLCKTHGYSYIKHEYCSFFIKKRTANGHYILLEADVGPSFQGVGIGVRYTGVGFDHLIGSTFRYPQTQENLENYLSQVFLALVSAEQAVIPALDKHYPPTPDWFMPVLF